VHKEIVRRLFGVPLIQIYFRYPPGRGSKLSGEHWNMLRYNFVHRDLAETFCGSMAGGRALKLVFSFVLTKIIDLLQGIRRR
jgi:hypothetical protein